MLYAYMCALLIRANVSDSEHNQQWRRGRAQRATLSRGRHFKEDKKISACVRSFKCFTSLDIRQPEVFCDV